MIGWENVQISTIHYLSSPDDQNENIIPLHFWQVFVSEKLKVNFTA